jgi:hypothetical protein
MKPARFIGPGAMHRKFVTDRKEQLVVTMKP